VPAAVVPKADKRKSAEDEEEAVSKKAKVAESTEDEVVNA
jgi:hypothetical protein